MDGKRSRLIGGARSKLQRGAAVAAMFQAKPTGMGYLVEAVQEDQAQSNHLSKLELESIKKKARLAEDINAIYRLFGFFDFDGSGSIRTEDAPLVLSELGIQPTSPEERRWVHGLVAEHRVAAPGVCSFRELVALLVRAREEVRTWRWAECLRLFDAAGGSTTGRLTKRQLDRVLKESVMLAPQDKGEEVEIENMYRDMSRRDTAGLSFQEFEELLQRLRLVLSLKRCEEQVSRGRAMSLRPSMIAEFRWELKTFIKIFRRYLTKKVDFQIIRDEGLNDDASSLDEEDTVAPHNLKGFLIDTGVLGWDTICMPHVLNMLPRMGSDIDMVLETIRNIRERITAEAREELQGRFNHYARNNRDLMLQKRDIYDILSEFGMTPKTRDEQIKVATIIDRFDEDCTGTFQFDEFRVFYLRLMEQHRFLKSEREYKVVRMLKMKPWQFARLRATFIGMGPDQEGRVSQKDLVGVFPELHQEFTGRTGRSPRLLEEVRSSPDKKVDFLGFARLVHLSMIDAQHYHSLGALSTVVSGWTAEELLCGEGEDGEISDGTDDSAQDVPSQHVVAKEGTEVIRIATTKLDVEFRTWVWDEVMSASRRFNESHLARLEANTKEFVLQDMEAWNTLRGRIVDQLSPTLGAARVDRVLPIKCETGVPIFQVPVTSLTLAGDLAQLANLRRDYSMQLLGVEFGDRRGHVVTVIGEPPEVSPGDRLWVGFEGGGFRRGDLERMMGSDDLDRLQWSMLPTLLCPTPLDLSDKTLRECKLEQEGAVVCGLKRKEGMEVFPGDHWKLVSSITGLLVHMFSPIRFVSAICAMSSHSTTARLEMRLNNGIIGLPNFDEGSAPQAPLDRFSERCSLVPSEVGSEQGSPPSPLRASNAKANFLSLLPP